MIFRRYSHTPFFSCLAEVAELVDALASGASGGNPVEVQVLSSAPCCGARALYDPRAGEAGILGNRRTYRDLSPLLSDLARSANMFMFLPLLDRQKTPLIANGSKVISLSGISN